MMKLIVSSSSLITHTGWRRMMPRWMRPPKSCMAAPETWSHSTLPVENCQKHICRYLRTTVIIVRTISVGCGLRTLPAPSAISTTQMVFLRLERGVGRCREFVRTGDLLRSDSHHYILVSPCGCLSIVGVRLPTLTH